MVDTKVDKTLRARTADGAYKRPNFPTEFKRQLVERKRHLKAACTGSWIVSKVVPTK
jgi:hypothetical protein